MKTRIHERSVSKLLAATVCLSALLCCEVSPTKEHVEGDYVSTESPKMVLHLLPNGTFTQEVGNRRAIGQWAIMRIHGRGCAASQESILLTGFIPSNGDSQTSAVTGHLKRGLHGTTLEVQGEKRRLVKQLSPVPPSAR
jgi:hypothetical protein